MSSELNSSDNSNSLSDSTSLDEALPTHANHDTVSLDSLQQQQHQHQADNVITTTTTTSIIESNSITSESSSAYHFHSDMLYSLPNLPSTSSSSLSSSLSSSHMSSSAAAAPAPAAASLNNGTTTTTTTPTGTSSSHTSSGNLRSTIGGGATDLDSELSSLLTRKQPRFAPQAPKCDKCQTSVYKAEEIRAANKIFHKLCFKCTGCGKLLETSKITDHQGDLYCRMCYTRHFGPKGYGYSGVLSSEQLQQQLQSPRSPPVSSSSIGTTIGGLKSTFSSYNVNPILNSSEAKENTSVCNSSVNSSSSETTTPTVVGNFAARLSHAQSNEKQHQQQSSETRVLEKKTSTATPTSTSSGGLTMFVGADKCGRCSKSVYAAEKIVAAGRAYHKLCFSCHNCKKMLSSMNCCDNSDGNVFCKACYGKHFGPKGVGFGALKTN